MYSLKFKKVPGNLLEKENITRNSTISHIDNRHDHKSFATKLKPLLKALRAIRYLKTTE